MKTLDEFVASSTEVWEKIAKAEEAYRERRLIELFTGTGEFDPLRIAHSVSHISDYFPEDK